MKGEREIAMVAIGQNMLDNKENWEQSIKNEIMETVAETQEMNRMVMNGKQMVVWERDMDGRIAQTNLDTDKKGKGGKVQTEK